jgi:hypothetical protein
VPTVYCKLTDCQHHGTEVCTARNIYIDGCGMVECYRPVPRSSLVHAPVNPNCRRTQRGYKSTNGGVLR